MHAALFFALALLLLLATSQACEVCEKVIDDVRASMSKPDSRDKPKIESALVSLPVDGRASHDSALAGAGHGSQGL
ncbi:hypothetical protein TeGR_g10052 [Tetraparma gracilis]|uniref:Uncharacterized protein n=1 Tax=Tetraparma gracilis TaxID=2962635 RepID=A0ABQ6N519_9STRA|nr:hypothetical protein TeGR_g10052 [Tetraparma gracilis]